MNSLSSKLLLDDLAKLYMSLNHGDDEELLRIVEKYDYTFKYDNHKAVVVPLSEKEMDEA